MTTGPLERNNKRNLEIAFPLQGLKFWDKVEGKGCSTLWLGSQEVPTMMEDSHSKEEDRKKKGRKGRREREREYSCVFGLNFEVIQECMWTQSDLKQKLSSADPKRTSNSTKCTAKQGVNSRNFGSKPVQGFTAKFCACPKVWWELREQYLQNVNGFDHSSVDSRRSLGL